MKLKKRKVQVNEEKRQHLEFIQNAIIRMNTNSFKIKKLAVTLTGFFFALHRKVSLILTIIIIFCWILDSYYLRQERKFRGIYDDVIGLKNLNEVKPYEMPIHKYTADKDKTLGFGNVLFSKTLLCFYLGLIIVVNIFFIYW